MTLREPDICSHSEDDLLPKVVPPRSQCGHDRHSGEGQWQGTSRCHLVAGNVSVEL